MDRPLGRRHQQVQNLGQAEFGEPTHRMRQDRACRRPPLGPVAFTVKGRNTNMRPGPIIAALIAVLCTATIVYTQNVAAQPKPATTQPVVAPVSPMPIVVVPEQPKL